MTPEGMQMRVPERRPRHIIPLALAVGFTITLSNLADLPKWVRYYPRDWKIPADKKLTEWFKFLAEELDFGWFTFLELTRGSSWIVAQFLKFMQGVLGKGFEFYGDAMQPYLVIPQLPWVAVTGIFCLLAYWASGRALALMVGIFFVYFAAFGLWEGAMLTLASVFVAVLLGMVIGVLLGTLGFRSRLANTILTPIYDVMQTTPIFAYLVPVLVFFGFGPVAALLATIVFAMPPMARVTTLALQRVPTNTRDFGDMAGCTQRQKMWLVMLPSARQSLLIGLNQVIMLSLAAVIVASIIGAGGLGANVYRALTALQIGDAVEAGLAITLMAIALDRISQGVAMRRPSHRVSIPSNLFKRHPLITTAVLLVIATSALSLVFPAIHTYPSSLTISTGDTWNDFINWLNVNHHEPLGAFRDFFIIYLLKPVKLFFIKLPWPGVILVATTLAYALAGWRLALLTVALLGYIALSGYWKQGMFSLYLVFLAVIAAMLIGGPIGVWAALNRRVDKVVTVVIDTLQTLPTFVYLIPVVMLWATGEFPAYVAIVVYAVLPAIRYTKHGIQNIPRGILEATDLSGATRTQKLFQVQIPLALPDIMLGINQVLMMAFGMLVITALVGTRGLEHEALFSLGKVQPGRGIVSGLGIAFLSIVADRMITAASIHMRRKLGLAPSVLFD